MTEIECVCEICVPLRPDSVIRTVENMEKDGIRPVTSKLSVRNGALFLDMTMHCHEPMDTDREDRLAGMLKIMTGGSVMISVPEKESKEPVRLVITDGHDPAVMKNAKEALKVAKIPVLNIPNANDRMFLVPREKLSYAKDALHMRRIRYKED